METNNHEQDRCWYCGKPLIDDKSNRVVTMYRETGRTTTTVEFQSLSLSVPRCEECKKNHRKGCLFQAVFIIVYIALWVLALVKSDEGSIDMSPRTIFFIGLPVFVAIILFFRYLTNNRAKKAGIKKEDDIEGYYPYEELKMQGWTENRPSA